MTRRALVLDRSQSILVSNYEIKSCLVIIDAARRIVSRLSIISAS
jgi:hypothetical protein